MKTYQIICIDEDEQFLRSLENLLPNRVETLCPRFRLAFEFVSSVGELFELLANSRKNDCLAMVICDQLVPGVTGVDLIERLKKEHPDFVSIMMTGPGELDAAKYAVNSGRLDQYISKPIEDIHAFVAIVANMLKRYHLEIAERDRTEQLTKTVLQLRASNETISTMQTAAEEVFAFAKTLNNLGTEEIVEAVSREMPKFFDAQQVTLCFASQDACPVPAERFRRHESQVLNPSERTPGRTCPHGCVKLEGHLPDMIVPLSIGNASSQQAHVCIRQIAQAAMSYPETVKYKAGLVAQILSLTLDNASLRSQADNGDGKTDFVTGKTTRNAGVPTAWRP